MPKIQSSGEHRSVTGLDHNEIIQNREFKTENCQICNDMLQREQTIPEIP